GRVLYQRPPNQGQTLVAPFVAAGITDLLQTAVNIGTGRAAQIGRPVAGKTGTTSSNKDGWFMGFSSGITTGVWMGRDDAKPIPGLMGGTAPARAFSQYMRVAVAGRPVEQFDTQLKLPEWQLEPDDESYLNNPGSYYYTDDQGNLVEGAGNAAAGQQQQQQQGDGTQPADQPRAPVSQPRAPVGRPASQPLFAPGEQGGAPAAANQDFLDQATGSRSRANRRVPPPQ
ncbi:MAG TPA: penicillin-binding transpeptidase domain-containing protein, partial [Novosphingobium sp.]|nr:penicillin-binding transpeptidase domain-containing protein [Novosphingobium sp.]